MTRSVNQGLNTGTILSKQRRRSKTSLHWSFWTLCVLGVSVSASAVLYTSITLTWLLTSFVAILLLLSVAVSGDFVFGISTDVNSGDVDDTFAIAYAVTEGFFVKGNLSFFRAMLRWLVPYMQPCIVRIALESTGDMQHLLRQLNEQMYGPVTRVCGGFLTKNYELIEVYQGGNQVSFPQPDQPDIEVVPISGVLGVKLLEIAGPTSCMFSTTRRLLYVGRVSVEGQSVNLLAGANAKELSRDCVENALQNGARVEELPPKFSRRILCSLDSQSPLLAIAAQLQLNPWAFSFLQTGPAAFQFADSNQENGTLLLAKMDLTYEKVWQKLDCGIKKQVTDFTSKFSDWDNLNVIRNRVLWAVINFGGKFPWKLERHTSVSPPFSDLCSILNIDSHMTPLDIFEFRVKNVAKFTGLAENTVAKVLCHAVLYDLYAMVLLKYGLTAEEIASDRTLLSWFSSHVQQFVDHFSSQE